MEMKKFKLGEICKKITDGEHASVVDDLNGEYFLLSNKNIIDDYILINNTDRRINKSTFDKINKRINLTIGDVLISTVGTIGKTAILKEVSNYVFQRSVGIIRPNQEILNSEYLKYLLDSKTYQKKLHNTSKGAVQKCLFIGDLENFELSLPPLTEQKKIAAVLGALDKKIALNKQMNKTLEAIAKQLYDYYFVQFDFPNSEGAPYKTSGGCMVYNPLLKREIPMGWEVKKIKDVVEKISTGLNPRQNFTFSEIGIKYITVKNLQTDGTIDFLNCDYIDEDARKLVHKRSDISKGDILFASIAPLGRCYQIMENPKDWDINESVFSIRPNLKECSSEYLFSFFTSQNFVALAENNSFGSIFNGIRINTLLEMNILVPEKNVLKTFSEKTEKIRKMIFIQNEQISSLTAQRDALLPLLMNGQVVVE